jgi:hypothetical protein
MPTFEVKIDRPEFEGRARVLHIPAPSERLARERGVRRAIALVEPKLGTVLDAEDFNALAARIAPAATAKKVAA